MYLTFHTRGAALFAASQPRSGELGVIVMCF